MNKGELIEKIYEKNAKDFASKAAAARAVESVFDEIMNAVKTDGEAVFAGFGSFKAQKRAAREGRNPQTGAAVKIPATTVVKFKAGSGFKEIATKAKTKK